MEIIGGGRERNTVYIAVVSLALIGIALVASTWQIVRNQREAGMAHLELTALSVLQAVDSSLRRGPMMGRNRLSQDARDYFRELENSGDIVFVGIIDENGNRQMGEGENRDRIVFPPEALLAMQSGARWHGVAVLGDSRAYVALRYLQGSGGAPQENGPGFRRGENRRHHREDAAPVPRAGPGLFLMVAVDMNKHFAIYGDFKKTAVFQTAYILAAAIFLWMLAARFISRRNLAKKAVLLERFQAKLIDSLPDGLLITNNAGIILAANPAAGEIFADRGQALVGRNLADLSLSWTSLVGPPSRSGSDWRQIELEGMQLEVRGLPFQSETRPDGSTPSFMVIIRDRTRIRTLEKNLAEAEKLAAIGSLAAGVAHEIRNPLSALRGFAQYFAKKLAGRQPEEEYAQTMVRESDRLNRVITDLLYLARPRNAAPVLVDLAAMCDEMRTLLHFELREQNLHLECALEAPVVFADPDALKQALLNLLLNSLEALEEWGEDSGRVLKIRSEPGLEHGRPGVRLTVSDTGPGMDREAAANACKPFFTTKKKGTGLGLALVRTIMQGHNGVLTVTSPFPAGSGGGCAVSLFFPDTPASQTGDS